MIVLQVVFCLHEGCFPLTVFGGPQAPPPPFPSLASHPKANAFACLDIIELVLAATPVD